MDEFSNKLLRLEFKSGNSIKTKLLKRYCLYYKTKKHADLLFSVQKKYKECGCKNEKG